MRHRIRRATLGKDPIKKSSTQILTIGQGTATIQKHILIQTDVGPRIASGAKTVIRDAQDTGNKCNVGDIVKYINICIQAGSRNVTGDVPIPDDNGWLEYALVYNKTTQLTPAVTNIGTQTLADICTASFRGDVIFTGCIPIGASQTTFVDLKIKIPKIFCKMQWGSQLTIFYFNRSVNVADVRSDSLRLVSSCLYKVYV